MGCLFQSENGVLISAWLENHLFLHLHFLLQCDCATMSDRLLGLFIEVYLTIVINMKQRTYIFLLSFCGCCVHSSHLLLDLYINCYICCTSLSPVTMMVIRSVIPICSSLVLYENILSCC